MMEYLKSIPETSLLILLVIFNISVSTSPNIISITKCCAVNESYVIGFDSCQPVSSNDSSSTIFQQYDPPIYSIISSENRTLIEDASSQIQLEVNLPNCPEGFVHNVSTDFFLYENGSLSIPQFGIWRTRGEFCIDEFETFDPQEPVKVTARFCVPDPCLGVNCIRKCCPEGMALYIGDGIYCRVTTDPTMVFDHFALQNLSEASPDSYVVRNGVAPQCPNGIQLLEYHRTSEIKPFSILRNGLMSVTNNLLEINHVIDDYCIDSKTEFDQNQTVAAGLICYDPEWENSWILNTFPYFLLASSGFLIATFIVYALVPEMRNLHGLSVMCHVASLAVTCICLAINQLTTNIGGYFCIGIATVLHFFFLSAFSWMNVISFYTWWIFRNLRSTTGRNMNNKLPFLYCSFYGWGLPLIIVLIGRILDIAYYDRTYYIESKNRLISNDGIIRPDFGAGKCWFTTKASIVAYLYGPIGFLILANFVLFVLTIISLYRASKDTLAARKQEATQKFRVFFSLFILMGIPWIMDIFSFLVSGNVESWITTDIFNILTGVIVFILFVCKPTVWSRLRNRFPCLERLNVSLHQHLSGLIRMVLRRDSPAEELGSNNQCDSSSAQQHSQQTASSSTLTPTTSQSSNHFEFNISSD